VLPSQKRIAEQTLGVPRTLDFLSMNISSSHSESQDCATCCVLLFLRLPELDKVKTRLAHGIGQVHALEVYRCFIQDELATLDGLGAHSLVCFTPEDGGEKLASWLGADRAYLAQQGGDLGARMDAAFRDAFARGFDRVLLLGSDIPDVPGQVLARGLSFLESFDACLAPSLDGGYYCIGFSKAGYCPAVFRGMAWSTPQVCTLTQDILAHKKRSVYMLDPWQDVDTREDLAALCTRIGPDDASQTRSYLQGTGLWDDLRGKHMRSCP